MEKENSQYLPKKRGNPAMQKGKPSLNPSGKTKGTKAKLTKTLKEAIELSFHEVGGVEYLKGIALAEPSTYLALVGKIIPKEVVVDLSAKYADMTLEEKEAEAKRMAQELFGSKL